MDHSTNPATLVAWGGGALGFIFGAVANRTNFCTMGSVSDVVNMGSWADFEKERRVGLMREMKVVLAEKVFIRNKFLYDFKI